MFTYEEKKNLSEKELRFMELKLALFAKDVCEYGCDLNVAVKALDSYKMVLLKELEKGQNPEAYYIDDFHLRYSR